MKLPLDREHIQQYEPRFEVLYWVAAVGCFALLHLPGIGIKGSSLYSLGGGLAVCALVWYHVLPKSWIGFRKTFYGAVFTIACVTVFACATGGVNSLFGFLYFLPILASFLILDTLRAWVVYGLVLVGWGVVYLVDALRAPMLLDDLAPHVLINVFVITLGTAFTALFSRQLHCVILRERTMGQQLQQSQAQSRSTTDKLAHANQELHRLSRVKDDFVAMVNHDLRTPLTAMKQAVNLFLKGTLGPLTLDQREYMALMARNLNRLTELITNLLDLSKLQAGKLQMDITPCRLEEIVHETVSVHQPLLAHRTVEVHIPHDLPMVFADRNRMIQVVGNLVSNAAKFTPEGGQIKIHASMEDAWVRLAVEDTGVGIAPDKQERLFTKYDRLGADASRPGTGLGLAICRELVELQHGNIDVQSILGGGTTVRVALPVAVTSASETEVLHG